MNWYLALTFGLGLMVGSFLNVVVHRLPRMIISEPNDADHDGHFNLFLPNSHCPHCLTPLKAWQNIPVLSFLWLKGRSACCGESISLMYPALEILTALSWFFCAWHWGFNTTGLCWAFFITVLIALSAIDLKTTLLPDLLTQPLVWMGLIASTTNQIALSVDQSIWGAATGYTSLWLIATVFKGITGKEGMGAGDFKLLAALGAWLGPLSLIPLVLMASLSGAIVGLYLQLTRRLNKDAYIPFGPFLAVAGVLIASVGPAFVTAWLSDPFVV